MFKKAVLLTVMTLILGTGLVVLATESECWDACMDAGYYYEECRRLCGPNAI